MSIFEGSSIVIVTGASRGYGLELCLQLVKQLAKKSLLIMISRNYEKLQQSKDQVKSIVSDNDIQITSRVCDLSILDSIPKLIEDCLVDVDLDDYKNFFLFNNAGSLGNCDQSIDSILQVDEVKSYFDLNVSSCFLVTSLLLNKLKKSQISNKFVINTTSLFALQPAACFSMYCSGKAARDMFFRVLAAERSDIRVLNWSPGPMHTDMFDQLVNQSFNCKVVDDLKEMADNKTVVSCIKSIEKLFGILEKNEFASGDHIDYFEV